jgi:hypothetical protein
VIVNALSEDLEDYGGHVPVVVELPSGELRHIASLRAGSHQGEAVAVIELAEADQ